VNFDPEKLLDELARAYARAAVDRLIEEMKAPEPPEPEPAAAVAEGRVDNLQIPPNEQRVRDTETVRP